MSNKTALKKEVARTPAAKVIDKNKKEDTAPDKAVNKIKKPIKKSSLSQIESVERSAVDAVKAHSSKGVRGSSGLANTGTIISYD
jgi:hypothetical protein